MVMPVVCHSEFLSYNNCTEKKTKCWCFFGSNDLAMPLIENILAMCRKSDTSVVQTHIPGQSSQETDFIVI